MRIKELDRVRTTKDITLDDGEILPMHSEGVVVDILRDGDAFDVEFVSGHWGMIIILEKHELDH